MKDNEIIKITIFGVILTFILTIGGYYLEEWVCGPCKFCGLKCNDCKCIEGIINEDR